MIIDAHAFGQLSKIVSNQCGKAYTKSNKLIESIWVQVNTATTLTASDDIVWVQLNTAPKRTSREGG